MAEVKNSFLQSKMNKDLDDRLIPNGQYRDALNISVGKSENDSIGALQNILGNASITNDLPAEDEGLICIGIFMDNQNNRIYQFLTNYTDPVPSGITPCIEMPSYPEHGWQMKITVYDYNTNPSYTTLVSGTFLNFSATNLVLGVNLIEGLLFWTDNRNQPRKININNALNFPASSETPYYTTETQISVAKYSPVEPISLLKVASAVVEYVSGNTIKLVDDSIKGVITPGMTVISHDGNVSGDQYMQVVSYDGFSEVELYSPISTLNESDRIIFLTSTMSDKSPDSTWPGDPSFLEDKYVRFSYRFKFDDNEYSLIAPFTQIAYIPKQKGFFINGDEAAAYKSTVLKWMENNVNNIELLVPLPDIGSNINNSYKITQLDILYKESDALAIKVLDSITYDEIKIASANTNIYNYPYQSQKPYKTLPEDQTTRVYDTVPVRALGQESSGNRVIYGNFYNMYTAPQNINYNTAIQPKTDLFTSFIEYPNHTVKQNRNYQVGFILADKFGRQSSVILSTVDVKGVLLDTVLYGGSTVYSAYDTKNMPGMPDVRNWFGNALLVLVNEPIMSTRNIPGGTPGLYAEPIGNGFPIENNEITAIVPFIGETFQYICRTDIGALYMQALDGKYMRGAFTDYVEILSIEDFAAPTYTITTLGRPSDMYLVNPDPEVDIKYCYTINEIGWYSYKIVVKQQQQEYYNVYLPGMLNGYPIGQTYGSQVVYTGVAADPSLQNGINITDFPVGEEGKTSHIVLINDNINKVPRDLIEVGPDQKLYRSSVSLYGKVQNAAVTIPILADDSFIIDNRYATTIKYLLADNGGAGLNSVLHDVKAGDAIQSNQANEQITNPSPPPATIINPDAWYANTVVVSNTLYTFTSDTSTADTPAGSYDVLLTPTHSLEIVSGILVNYTINGITFYNEVLSIVLDTITLLNPTEGVILKNSILTFIDPLYGLITFNPPNWTRSTGGLAYIDYTVTRAENTQYFPTRKADTVSAIATATDFNFLDNDVNNIKGTASVNFYQLQTKPSIGRVSTVNTIGVTGDKMIPFLSVYETSPVISALPLFWETTSTGYISDLNYDVLTGYDGPTSFTILNFTFYEYQNPLTNEEGPGTLGSPFITTSFYIQNNTGVYIVPESFPILYSVKNNSTPRLDVTNQFEIVEGTIDNTYRLKIKNDFVFDHNASTNSNFTFEIKIEWAPNTFAILPITGRLRNATPEFEHVSPYYDTFINQDLQDVVIVTAKNGSHKTINNQDGLYWDIPLGNEGGFFNISSSNGQISLINSNAPLGIYELTVRVQDAFGGDPATPLIGSETYYGSLEETTIVKITIGPKPVNNHLQYFDSGSIVTMPPSGASCPVAPGQGYAAIYVGSQNYTLNDESINIGLPDITLTSPAAPNKAFQNYVNVQIENGAGFGTVDPPTGLTQGELEWNVICRGSGSIDEDRFGKTQFLLYWRAVYTDAWQLVYDANNVVSPITNIWGTGIGESIVHVNLPSVEGGALRQTSFVTTNLGEYCLVLKQNYTASANEGSENPLVCNPGFYGEVIIKDANYSYLDPIFPYNPITTQPFPSPGPDPSIMPVEYNVALELQYAGDYPSGVPYDTQDATVGFEFISTGITTGAQPSTNSITMTAVNPQWVPGLSVVGANGSGFITDITGSVVTLSFEPLPAIPSGTTITFRTFPAFTGSVWATTNDGLHVKQFYTNEGLTIPWHPPIADKFYIYQNKERDYNVGIPLAGMGAITDKPYYSARFNGLGGVTQLIAPANTIKTAWKPFITDPLINYGRNLYQETFFE